MDSKDPKSRLLVALRKWGRPEEISNEMWEILPKYQATLRLPCYSDGEEDLEELEFEGEVCDDQEAAKNSAAEQALDYFSSEAVKRKIASAPVEIQAARKKPKTEKIDKPQVRQPVVEEEVEEVEEVEGEEEEELAEDPETEQSSEWMDDDERARRAGLLWRYGPPYPGQVPFDAAEDDSSDEAIGRAATPLRGRGRSLRPAGGSAANPTARDLSEPAAEEAGKACGREGAPFGAAGSGLPTRDWGARLGDRSGEPEAEAVES
ncbi:unnamed protein product [Effrenium voratum]|nr:unnamed protein product [Effrenium voratum]